MGVDLWVSLVVAVSVVLFSAANVGAVMPSFRRGVEAAWSLLELQQGSCSMGVVVCGVGSSKASSSFFPVLAMEPSRSGLIA